MRILFWMVVLGEFPSYLTKCLGARLTVQCDSPAGELLACPWS